jgi:tetratricopeptide (TPR) repeat protein
MSAAKQQSVVKTISPMKKCIFSLIALIGIPAIFFIALEGSLRLLNVGTDYDYFHTINIDGEPYFQDNKAFANQFYPPSLGVAPLHNTLKVNTDSDHLRVLVLGGSAAQGFPHVNHGLDRHLSAHLRAALPNKTIEVINTAMTSVNSHVVYEVARTLPENSADYAIILMGNNEVVGPYGPSTFSQNFSSSLYLIRTIQALKRSRTWQLVAMFVQKLQSVSAEQQEIEWAGMEMFSEFTVPHDDARLNDVYRHYQNNLQDIITLLQSKNIRVVLSSVPVNLRHSAPFGSSHKSDIDDADLKTWEQMNIQADTEFEAKNWQSAEALYTTLLNIDHEYADSHFRLATVLEHLGKFEQAKQHFKLALDYDTKRFRTDRKINEIIGQVAANERFQPLLFVDNVSVFDEASSPFAPGWNLLHEHVHFDFDGNYYLAREFTQAIMSDLAPANGYSTLTKAQATSLIGFPNHETVQIMNRLVGMVEKSPFTEQSNHAELVAFTQKRKQAISDQTGSPSDVIERRRPIVEQGLADWKMHYELAELNKFVRDNEARSHHLKELINQYPHNLDSLINVAEDLSSQGYYEAANKHLKRSLYYTRSDAGKEIQIFGMLGLNYMKSNNYPKGVESFERIIEDYSDNIPATIRAYGVIIKYARDNKQTQDIRYFLNAVQGYANGLIDSGNADEFPLLYRRMAQIMTLAGEHAEAKRWQAMQTQSSQ